MENRRTFLNKLGKGSALSAIALSSPVSLFSQFDSKKGDMVKPFKIGIIGAENSHTAGFGKLFNIDKAFPGMEVKYVWGETEEFAKIAMEKGNIPKMVKDPNDMLGKIDGLIVDHRHGKFHLEPAIPFIKAGIPTFIDKPFCYRSEEGKAFLALARKHGTPVTSFSSIAHSYETFDIKEQLKEYKEINQVVRYGPVKLDSEYGGIFFYGAHILQPVLYLFGDNVEKVQVHVNGINSSASLVFKNGMLVTLISTTKKYGWQTHIETEEGIIPLQAKSKDQSPGKNYVDMVEMFKTGKEPRSHESILYCVTVLEALEKSINSGQWETVQA
ncbi:Gfo/Idh/MocA family oxidoreductase [Aurantibacter crassamenti]|uniref:Gfo/Idh/MocA family protein n=1 Tax=Aurantibacter crassamenti TaxID=1837375 RepID=UPI00193ADE24|nr:Gfo/Idh/MocA family oxidoreductase [Aurantibacter crassamenti]MBM1105484.1 Gfo/Idh/MocA family oxidoreductase [Aurantibacter crassamenti]